MICARYVCQCDLVRFFPEKIDEIDGPLFIVYPKYPTQPTMFAYFGRSEGDADTLTAFIQV